MTRGALYELSYGRLMIALASENQFDGPPRRPTGVAHGFEDGSSATLCGVRLANLWIFPDIDFVEVQQRCEMCRDLAERVKQV